MTVMKSIPRARILKLDYLVLIGIYYKLLKVNMCYGEVSIIKYVDWTFSLLDPLTTLLFFWY